MNRYDIDIDQFIKSFPDYLKNPGNNVMITTELYYDIMNNYKNFAVDFWQHLDLNRLETDYIRWLGTNPMPGDRWKYTELVENLCRTYNISREHPIGRLNERHMIRLLKIKMSGIGFDGSRERFEEIYENIFPNMSFYFITANDIGATGRVYLKVVSSELEFDEIDEELFIGGYYFLELLGINLEFQIVADNALLYDFATYTDTQTQAGDETYYDNNPKGG